MATKAEILAHLRPHEVDDALRAVDIFESGGFLDAAEARAWRDAIREQAARFAPGTAAPQ